MIGADVHPATVVGQIVDAEGYRHVDVGADEVEAVVLHLYRITSGTPLPPRVRQLPQLFLLLGIDADHRLTTGLVLFDLLVDVAELCIPVGVLPALQSLGTGLQAEALPLQQPADSRSGDRVPLPGQLLCEIAQGLGGPAQRRHRITPLVRLHQLQQRRDQTRILCLAGLAATSGAPDAAARQRILTGLQLEHPVTDRGLAHPGHSCHGAYPAVSEQPSLLGHYQTPLTFIQVRQDDLKPQRELIQNVVGDAHTRATILSYESNGLLLYGFISCAMSSA